MAGPVVVLTGAGVSAESGLATFRDADGLWTRHDLAEVATPEGYARNPELVLEFYNARRRNCGAAAPNPAHRALARLARARTDVTIVTQNIDDLHERAGTPPARLIHMHGEIMGALCARCGHRWPWTGDMRRADACPACASEGGVRPDVVWFGEMPYAMETIAALLARCALFAAVGTSGSVYPAAGFVAEAASAGARTVEINLEPSDTAGLFDRRITGRAGTAVPAWVAEVLGEG